MPDKIYIPYQPDARRVASIIACAFFAARAKFEAQMMRFISMLIKIGDIYKYCNINSLRTCNECL